MQFRPASSARTGRRVAPSWLAVFCLVPLVGAGCAGRLPAAVSAAEPSPIAAPRTTGSQPSSARPRDALAPRKRGTTSSPLATLGRVPPRYGGDLGSNGLLVAWTGANWEHEEAFGSLLAHATLAGQVVVAIAPGEERWRVRRLVRDFGGEIGSLRFFRAALDTFWIRDFGPHIVRSSPSGEWEVVDLQYADDRPRDDVFPTRFGRRTGVRVSSTTLDLEGGHLLADGAGSCVITDDVLVRNGAGWTQGEVEDELARLFDCAQVLVVPRLRGESTGHVDVMLLLTGPRSALVGHYHGATRPVDTARLDHAAATLRAGGFSVTRVPMPESEHDGVFRTHTNAVVLRDRVLVPVFDADPSAELAALTVFGEAFPERAIVPIPADTLAPLDGLLHCVTVSLPAPLPLRSRPRRARSRRGTRRRAP